MENSTDIFTRDRERLKENLNKIQHINTLLKIAAIMGIISVVGLMFMENDFFIYVFIIGLLGAGIASYCCASATGHGMVDLSELGSGCGTFIYLPIYSVMYTYFILTGWVYGLVARSALLKENEQIVAQHGNKVLEDE